ncbi:Methionine aminopeptidase 2 [Cichlidogyrus casuarinus]|uniref:Microtubule-associated protein n=1 Tax=Cichlidogyrus casuarinus TaxID=1844966 RepID=A0ABD2PX81_9PLAT
MSIDLRSPQMPMDVNGNSISPDSTSADIPELADKLESASINFERRSSGIPRLSSTPSFNQRKISTESNLVKPTQITIHPSPDKSGDDCSSQHSNSSHRSSTAYSYTSSGESLNRDRSSPGFRSAMTTSKLRSISSLDHDRIVHRLGYEPDLELGSAPRMIEAKVGSLQNARHVPGGGNVKIFDQKIVVGHVKGKCESFANVSYKPGGGNITILNQPLQFENTPKVGSLSNIKHQPGGGNKPIEVQKVTFKEKAVPKVSSLANVKHKPAGGDKKLLGLERNEKTIQTGRVTRLGEVTAKVESLKNRSYAPGGGKVQIFGEKLPWLKYNAPNISTEEKKRINKHLSGKD